MTRISKPSTQLNKALKFYHMAESILKQYDEKLRELLDDDCAGISFSTDGLVVVYRSGRDNASLLFFDINKLLKLTDKEEALKILDKAGI